MYLGQMQRVENVYGRKFHVGIGDLPCFIGIHTKTLEVYQCENCGRRAEVLGRATEPFYCPDCQRLIGV